MLYAPDCPGDPRSLATHYSRHILLPGGARQEMIAADLLCKNCIAWCALRQEAIQIQMPFDDFLKRMRLEPERDTLKAELATVDFPKVGIGRWTKYL